MSTSKKKEKSVAIVAADLHLLTSLATINMQNRRANTVMATMAVLMLIMGIVIAMLMTKWEVETRFVTVNHDSVLGESYKILPSPLPPKQRELFVRSALRNYIVNRTMIDRLSEDIRFPRAFRASSPEVAATFKKEYEEGKGDFTGYSRDIEIIEDIAITPIGSVGIQQIEFKTFDYEGTLRRASNTKAINSWIATIRYVVMPEEVRSDVALENPIGVFIVKYVVRKKKDSREVASNANSPR